MQTPIKVAYEKLKYCAPLQDSQSVIGGGVCEGRGGIVFHSFSQSLLVNTVKTETIKAERILKFTSICYKIKGLIMMQ